VLLENEELRRMASLQILTTDLERVGRRLLRFFGFQKLDWASMKATVTGRA